MLENESGAIDAIDDSTPEVEVETVVETEAEELTIDKTEEEPKEETLEEPQEKPAKRKRPSGFHRKISRLEKRNAELEAQLEARVEPAKLDKRPELDDYETFSDYNAADKTYTEALVQRSVKTALTERDSNAEKAAKQTAAQTNWQQKVDALDSDYDDFEEVLAEYADYPVRKELRETMDESKVGPQLAYHLAMNPEVLEDLQDKSPRAFYLAIDKIEASLVKKPVARIGKAPAPIKPVKTSATTVPNLADMDFETYRAHLKKRI